MTGCFGNDWVSHGGKAALWTAAQDERFAMAILAQSGCAGAALWKRNFGENMEKMVTPNHNRAGGHSVEVSECLRFMESAGNRLRRP